MEILETRKCLSPEESKILDSEYRLQNIGLKMPSMCPGFNFLSIT